MRNYRSIRHFYSTARSSAGEGLEYRGALTFRRSAQGALTFESVPFVAGRMTGDGARHYSPSLSRRLVPDPMSEKYYDVSPYVYCANDPVNLVDSDGMDVFPKGEAELEMIRNTLPKEARAYVQLNEAGMIDSSLLNEYTGESTNFQNLREMVNSDMMISVSFSEAYQFSNPQGEISDYPMSYLPPDELMMDSSIEYTVDEQLERGEIMGKHSFQTELVSKTLQRLILRYIFILRYPQ